MLVQALERFVVEEIVGTRPYAVANVQILLDEEELPWLEGGDDGIRDDESKCKFLRGAAVAASFRYQYEFDKQMLPVPGGGAAGGDDDSNETYLTKDDVPWLQISGLLPFARYSTDDGCLDAANDVTARSVDLATTASGNDDDCDVDVDGGGGSPELPVERELWNGGVLWEPPHVPSGAERRRRLDDLDWDALETLRGLLPWNGIRPSRGGPMPNAPGDGLPRHRRSDDDRRRWVLPGAALGEVPEKPSTEEAELPGAGADRERVAPDEGHAPGVAERTEHGGVIAGRLGEVRVHQ